MHIGAFWDVSGTLFTSRDLINACFMQYYQDLYSFCLQYGVSVVSASFCAIFSFSFAQEKPNSAISLEEVQETIGQLQGSKTPGAYGLSTEFYFLRFELLPPWLTNLYSRYLFLDSLILWQRRILCWYINLERTLRTLPLIDQFCC